MHCYKPWNHALPWTTVTLLPSYPRHDSVPLLHCGTFHASRTSHLHVPCQYSLRHAPTITQCIPVGIEIHHYCGPSPVGLDINMHRRAQKNNERRYVQKWNRVKGQQIAPPSLNPKHFDVGPLTLNTNPWTMNTFSQSPPQTVCLVVNIWPLTPCYFCT